MIMSTFSGRSVNFTTKQYILGTLTDRKVTWSKRRISNGGEMSTAMNDEQRRQWNEALLMSTTVIITDEYDVCLYLTPFFFLLPGRPRLVFDSMIICDCFFRPCLVTTSSSSPLSSSSARHNSNTHHLLYATPVSCWYTGHVRCSDMSDAHTCNVHSDVLCGIKFNNFVAQLCCLIKWPVWHRELPNFWQVEQLGYNVSCYIETISILRQFFALSPTTCDWSILFVYMPLNLSYAF